MSHNFNLYVIEKIGKVKGRKALNVDNPVQAKCSAGIDAHTFPSTPKWVELHTEFEA
jgi:hypothetical protein